MRQLVNDSGLYGVSILINQVMRFIFVPVLTYSVSPEEFGAYDAARNLVVIGLPLIGLGMESAVAILYNSDNDRENQRKVASTGLTIVWSISLLVLILAVFYFTPLYILFMGQQGNPTILLLAIGSVVLGAPTEFGRNLLKWQFQRRLFSFLLIAEAVLVFLLGTFAVLVLDLGVVGWMLATIVSSVMILSSSLWVNRRFWCSPEISRMSSLIILGVPFVIVSLSGLLLPVSTRVILVNIAGLYEIGIFGVGERVAMIAGLLVAGFTMAWGPFYLSKQRDPHAKEIFGRVASYYLFGACTLGLLVYLFRNLIISVIAPIEYAAAQRLILPLVALKLSVGVDYIVAAGIYIRRKTYHLIWTTLLGGALAIILSYAWIPQYGSLGAAYAILLGKIVSTSATLIVSQMLFPISYESGRILGLVSSIAIVSLTVWVLPDPTSFLSTLLYGIAISGIFILFSILLGVLSQQELHQLRQILLRTKLGRPWYKEGVR